ncbi:MAG: hypothetical protein ACW99U_12965 [Candidatus Thorarchaeota archaeon]
MEKAAKMKAILNRKCGNMLLQEATRRLQVECDKLKDVEVIMATAKRMKAMKTMKAMQQKRQGVLQELEILREERRGLYQSKFLER